MAENEGDFCEEVNGEIGGIMGECYEITRYLCDCCEELLEAVIKLPPSEFDKTQTMTNIKRNDNIQIIKESIAEPFPSVAHLLVPLPLDLDLDLDPAIIEKKFRIANPHLLDQRIHIAIHLMNENFILVQEFFVFLEKRLTFVEGYVLGCQLVFGLEFYCQHVYEIEAFLVEDEIEDCQVAAQVLARLLEHLLRSLNIFILRHNRSQHTSQPLQRSLPHILHPNLLQSLQKRRQDIIPLLRILNQYLSNLDRILNRLAQQIAPSVINA